MKIEKCEDCFFYQKITVTNGYCTDIDMYISPSFKPCDWMGNTHS